jgi:hypothetical protein
MRISPWWNLSRVVLTIKNFRGSRTLSIFDSTSQLACLFCGKLTLTIQ